MEDDNQVSSMADANYQQHRFSPTATGSRNEETKQSWMENIKLPLGYQFLPTDTELIDFLSLKISNQPLPPHRIETLDLYSYHPQQLSDMYKLGKKRKLHLLTPRPKKYTNGSRANRGAVGGYWKAIRPDNPIKSDTNGGLVGYKNLLVFYEGKFMSGVKTHWMMQEYRIANKVAPSRVDGDLKFNDWVICKIYINKKTENQEQEVNDSLWPMQIHP